MKADNNFKNVEEIGSTQSSVCNVTFDFPFNIHLINNLPLAKLTLLLDSIIMNSIRLKFDFKTFK